jgi:hypothetical protein
MATACSCLLARCWRGCQWLAIEMLALLCALARRCWPAWARVPIVVQCGDAATRRATATVLRRALRDGQRVLGRPPALPLRVRVLAAAGTPPAFADLGHALAVCQVRPLPGGPRAVLTLAVAAGERRLNADQLVVALAAALDWLDGWQVGEAAVWSLPAQPGAAPARLAHDRLRWLPPRSSAPPVPPAAQPPAAAEAPPDDPLGLSGG